MSIKEIRKIAVIGLGTMGPGLAESFAQAGYRVAGYDVNPKAVLQCKREIEAIFEMMMEFDRITPQKAQISSKNIHYTDSLEAAVKDAQIIIEAISENREDKRTVFDQIDKSAPSDSLIWSNTSSLNIFELIPTGREENTVIAHWFSPPHIMPLVEVVKGPHTLPRTVETTLTILTELKKIPVVLNKYVPGFLINRIQRTMGREVLYLLGNGYTSPEDLDLAVKASIAPRMMVLGLVQRYDFTGLDLSARNLLDENFTDPPMDNKPAALYSKIDKGDLGVKTGRGFYDYSDRDITEVLKARDRHLIKVMEGIRFCLGKERLV